MTAAEEEKKRRKLAWEAQQARQLYEELVLKKSAPQLVQIGSSNGNGSGNGHPKSAEEPTKVSV
jgi:hypothetical protein